MLIRFNIKNFMSFNGTQEFSTIAGKVKSKEKHLIVDNDLKLLKFSAIYGANASGKSNFVKGIEFGKNIICNGIKFTDTHNKYFKNAIENKEIESSFEYEIMLGTKKYAYGFNMFIYDQYISGEWLYEIGKKNDKLLFEREYNFETESYDTNYDLDFVNTSNETSFEVWMKDANRIKNELLITEISRKNVEAEEDFVVFNEIYDWFKNSLIIIYPNSQVGGTETFMNGSCNERTSNLLGFFDTGITSFENIKADINEIYKFIPKKVFDNMIEQSQKKFKEVKELKETNGESVEDVMADIRITGNGNIFNVKFDDGEPYINKLSFIHGENNSNATYDLYEESDGTRRLIDLLEVMQILKNKGKTFIIDEVDRSLHPQLTRKFVETFLKIVKEGNCQLIATTHESSLLDLDLLRRDEIWFVERNTDYSSKLFSLDQFKERYDKVIEKSYLNGRYGAVPVFKDFDSYCRCEDGE